MQQAIQEILEEIPTGCVFDSHFVIARLIKHYSDEYLMFATGVSAATYKTFAVHGNIGQEISKFEGSAIRRLDHESWSENIHGNVSNCTCWQKV